MSTEDLIRKLKALLVKACTCEEFLLETLTREEWEFLKAQKILRDDAVWSEK